MSAATPEEYGPRSGIIAPLPAPERGVAIVTSVSPDGKSFIYGHSTNVIVRDVENPSKIMVYSEHAQPVKTAKFAPSGKYIASGDNSGKVRIWAYTHPSHVLKFECAALGGEVEDLAWDSESKRIVAVGGGQTKAKVFAWDTGSNLGEVVPHSKKAISCDIRPARPVRMVTSGEDFNVQLYSGPPFRYSNSVKEHSHFVNAVRYSPDGSKLISVSSDKSGVVYDGETGAVLGKLTGHAGSIYAVSYSPDSQRCVTAGGDKTVRVWDLTAPGFPQVDSFTAGTRPDDMQMSVVWAGPWIISTALDGSLLYFDANAVGAGPVRRVQGHAQPLNCLSVDRGSGRVFSGCVGGRVCAWTPSDADKQAFRAAVLGGEQSQKKVTHVVVRGGEVAVVGWDDKLRFGPVGEGETGATLTSAVALGAQPKGLAVPEARPSLRIVVTSQSILLVEGTSIIATVPAPYTPTCVAVSPSGTLVAVGGADKRVHIYSLAGDALTEQATTAEANFPIASVDVSPDASLVVAGDAGKEVRLFDAAGATLVSGKWTNHTTRVTDVKFSPNGAHIASVSSDRRLCIWAHKDVEPVIAIDLANPQPFIACDWVSDNELWTLGSDGVASLRKLNI